MNNFSYIYSPATQSWTFQINGKTYTVAKGSHANYFKIEEALKARDFDSIEELIDVSKAIANYVDGRVSVRNGNIYYDDQAVHNHIADRITELMSEGLPFEPMVKFLDNLMSNPSRNSVEQLYTFLEHKALPITEDGCFLGYKGVKKNFYDIYSGRFDNSVGKILEVPRNTVDDNFNNECSHGLHVGCLEYATNYAGSEGVLVVVKVNPRDCVAVPQDHNYQKLRTCKYEVVSLFEGALEKSPLYNSNAQPLTYDDFSFENDFDKSENDYEDEDCGEACVEEEDECDCDMCTANRCGY